MVSDKLLAEIQRLNRAEKLRVVQLLVNELANEAEFENSSFTLPNIEDALDDMAADPDIQREIGSINAEFATTESDGLTDNDDYSVMPSSCTS